MSGWILIMLGKKCAAKLLSLSDIERSDFLLFPDLKALSLRYEPGY